ncbi:PREDICTED: proline synthase co-transcribed bacterial homolog protein-like isoform X1 [Rhagoletis zephyria]|uniref:proline synthase co-transcribed bacterial homolog protein-like isoform X1 n=1 Tax=Rhagoletis zephyria TaxID=28612 RepID=UPI0008112B5F|nr:PREDICTED: proline synthase co-transcribed bacterial homolog protein-like isoform X1 [Rhagoletis zephyria]
MLRAMSEVNVKAGIECILKRIEEAYARRPAEHVKMAKPLLVAVSKTKPVEMIIESYTAGQRHFGENYVQELVEKAQHPDILQHCPEIKWHFIGHLQNNKINKILKLPNLYMIQTVDSEKLATGLDSAWGKIHGDNKTPLSVLVQVNTSGEEAKNGVQPSETPALFKYIHNNLKNLKLEGLMTIGAFGFDYTSGPNPDFISLMNVHRLIFEENALEPHAVQVSMGMSDDFEKAIEAGSTIVRVGSAIFGFRPKKTA